MRSLGGCMKNYEYWWLLVAMIVSAHSAIYTGTAIHLAVVSLSCVMFQLTKIGRLLEDQVQIKKPAEIK